MKTITINQQHIAHSIEAAERAAAQRNAERAAAQKQQTQRVYSSAERVSLQLAAEELREAVQRAAYIRIEAEAAADAACSDYDKQKAQRKARSARADYIEALAAQQHAQRSAERAQDEGQRVQAAIERAEAEAAEREKREAFKPIHCAINHNYYVCIMDEENNVISSYYAVAESAKEVHSAAAQQLKEGQHVRVYFALYDAFANMQPIAVQRCALWAAAKSIKNAVKRGGTPTERAMDKALSAAMAKTAQRADDMPIDDIIGALDADSQNFFSEALQGLLDGCTFAAGKHKGEALQGLLHDGSIEDAVHAAFVRINQYSQKQRERHEKEVSTEYITGNDGQLVSITQAIAQILKKGEAFTQPTESNMDNDTAEQLAAALHNAFSTLAPTDKEIINHITDAYFGNFTYGNVGANAAQIARAMHRNESTIIKHMYIIRDKVAQYLKDTNFSYLIDIQAVIDETQRKAAAAEDAERAQREARKGNAAYQAHKREVMRSRRAAMTDAERAAQREKDAARKRAARAARKASDEFVNAVEKKGK